MLTTTLLIAALSLVSPAFAAPSGGKIDQLCLDRCSYFMYKCNAFYDPECGPGWKACINKCSKGPYPTSPPKFDNKQCKKYEQYCNQRKYENTKKCTAFRKACDTCKPRPDPAPQPPRPVPNPPRPQPQPDYPTRPTPAPWSGAFPFDFTSTFVAAATDDTIVDATGPVPGLSDATGTFQFGINADDEIICYNIVLANFPQDLDYASQALTATHLHEGAAGQTGPPRIVFPNPQYQEESGLLQSIGCLVGPFTTGILDANGVDTGNGFSLSQIENNPADFFADTHLDNYLAGAVRGQLSSRRGRK